ncbi:MAG: class I SAM-dependent methyltransferase [Actinomycetota bacterium]
MLPRTSQAGSVEAFYDGFLESRMLKYRIDGNLRLDLAKQFVLSRTRATDTVADIGCGIGIVAEAVAKAHRRAHVIGVDISPANIRFARNTVRRPNVRFVQVDVTEQFRRLGELSPAGYDVIALVDVIEHIPATERPRLFSELQAIARPDSTLLMTYPSPEYQRHLMAHNPGELQIVDNVIELDELCREAGLGGWSLQSFARVDAWLQGQYIHCAFDRRAGVAAARPARPSILRRISSKVDRMIFRRYRAFCYRRRMSDVGNG